MKNLIGLWCLVLPLFLALSIPARAETGYVSDQLIISLRASADLKAGTIRTLKTDTPLEILEKAGSFLKVRTPAGEIGYVLSQYISKNTPKQQVIADLQKKIELLELSLADPPAESGPAETALRQEQEEKIRALAEEAAALNETLSKTKKELQSVVNRYDALLKTVGAAPAGADELARLRAENARLTTEMQIRPKDIGPKRPNRLKWFLSGSGVFLVGIILGKLGRRKKRIY